MKQILHFPSFLQQRSSDIVFLILLFSIILKHPLALIKRVLSNLSSLAFKGRYKHRSLTSVNFSPKQNDDDAMIEDRRARSKHSQLEQCLSSDSKKDQSIVVVSVEARSSSRIRQRKRIRQTRPEASTEERGSVLMGLCPTREGTVPDLKHQKKTKSQDTNSPYESCLSVMLKPKAIPNVDNRYAQPPSGATMGGILSIVHDLNRTEKRQGNDPPLIREKNRVKGLPGKNGAVFQVPKESAPTVLGGVLVAAQFQGGSLVSHCSDKPQQSTKQRYKIKDSIKCPHEAKGSRHLKKVSVLQVPKESSHDIPGGVLASQFQGGSLASHDSKNSQQSTKQRSETKDSLKHPSEKKNTLQLLKVPLPGAPKGRSHNVPVGFLAMQLQGGSLVSHDSNKPQQLPQQPTQQRYKMKDSIKHPAPFEKLDSLQLLKIPGNPSKTTHSQTGGGGSKARSLNGLKLQQSQVNIPAIHGLMGFVDAAGNDRQKPRREDPDSEWINAQNSSRQPSIASGSRKNPSTVVPENCFLRDTVSSNPSNAAKPSTNMSRVAIACAGADFGDASSNPISGSNRTKKAEKLMTGTKSTSSVAVGDPGKAEFTSLASLPSPPSPQQSTNHSRKMQVTTSEPFFKHLKKIARTTTSTSCEVQKPDAANDREADAASSQAVTEASESRKRKGNAEAETIQCGGRDGDDAALPSQKRPKASREYNLKQQQERGTNCEENPGKPSEESNQVTRMTSCEDVLFTISTQNNHEKQKAKSTIETLEVIVLNVDSSDAYSLTMSLAANCKDTRQLNRSLPSRALSRRILRQRHQPRRFCEEFISGPHNEVNPKPGRSCSPKARNSPNESNREAFTDQLQQLGGTSDNKMSRKPVQRRSDRKRTKPLRFNDEFEELFTDMEASKYRQNVARGCKQAAKVTRCGRSHRRGSMEDTGGNQRAGSKRKASGNQKRPTDKPMVFAIMDGNGCEKINREPAADPIGVIVINGSSSCEDSSKLSSPGAASIASPGNASARTIINLGLPSSSTNNSCACQRPRKRKVCCDQLEEVVNLQSLLQDCRNNAPIFNPVRDHNTFVVQPKTDVLARPIQVPAPTDESTCCYDDLAIDGGRTYLRILAHLPPNIMALEERSKTVPRHKNVSSAVDPALQAQTALLRGKRVPKRRAGVTYGSPLSSPKPDPLEGDHENVFVWSSEDMIALKTAYQQANAKSTTFWDDIAACVPGKTTLACRQQWFSSAKTPLQKKKSQKAHILSGDPFAAEDEDDLFNSTPLRGCNARHAKESLFSSFESGSPIKFDKHATSEPVMADDDDNLGIVDFRFKPGYKTYIRDMKKKVRRGQQQKKKQKPKRAKQDALIVSEMFGDGEVEMRGDLSPGGTLRVQNMFSDDEEDMFLHGSDAEEEEDSNA